MQPPDDVEVDFDDAKFERLLLQLAAEGHPDATAAPLSD